MKRFLMTVASAVVGLATLAVAQTRAEGHHGRGSEHSGYGASDSGSRSAHSYRPSQRFDYGRYGYRSVSWTHSTWSSYYGCSCYWVPSYGWCFYEPSYTYFMPVSRYFEVYPEAVRVGAVPVIPAPTTIQQTSVIVGSGAPVPVPTAVQQTRVVVQGNPGSDFAPAPPMVPVPPALQQTRVGVSGPG